MRKVLIFLFAQFAFVAFAQAQDPIPVTFEGRVMYSTGESANGVTVTMIRTVAGATSTQATVTDSDGNYNFQSDRPQGHCSVSWDFSAFSGEVVDDEPLPPSGTMSSSGCLEGSIEVADLVIARPQLITLAGRVRDQTFRPLQGLTVTMTRTKYNLDPPVVTTATTTTDGSGYYQFTVYSRCSVVEEFKASLGGVVFEGGASASGCVLSNYLEIDFQINIGSNLQGAGRTPCNGSIPRPVNVTNGNMYLHQGDYHLPGAGEALTITRTYNSISTSTGLFGRGWTTGYDETITTDANNRLQLTMPDGRLVTFATPDFFGQMVRNGDGSYTVTFKDGRVHQFNSSGKLLSQIDRLGNQTTLAYSPSGNLISVTDSFGRILSINTNANGQVLSISDTMGTIATYTYGANNELRSVTYADGSLFQFSYTPDLLLTAVTDALGNIVEQHDYDSQGRAITSETHGGVERYTLDYVSLSETDVTDALGHVTKYFYSNIRGRRVVTRVEGNCSCGDSQVQTWTYDDQSNVTSRSDALSHTMTYTYDGNGNRLTETDATGTSTYTYNQFDEVLTQTNQLNGLTTNTYDSQGNQLTTTNVLGKTTSFSYDARGQLLKITDARGKATSFAYDSSGNLITKTDPLNHATQFGYDARSRLTSVTNALGHVTALAYDGVGRPALLTQADGSVISYEYDLGGRLEASTDAKGNRTAYTYDEANRLTTETDALNQATSYEFDVMSNLTSRIDALARVTNFEYDDFNRLKKVIYPPATTGATRLFETLTYDGAGNVIQRTDTAGRITSFAYDEVNRPTSTTDADNKVTSFEYDPLSRTTAVVDTLAQRYRFNYDPAGQLRHVRRGSTVMSFTYDAVGNRKQRTDYNGALTTYDYDALHRLKTINYPDTTTVSYSYDKLSRLQTATSENGTIDLDYNKMNRLTSATDVFGKEVSYRYDDAGNRTRTLLDAATIATYRYDALNRLTRVTDGAGAFFRFGYDATSKLVSQSAPNNVSASYQYDGLDRLSRLTHARGATTIADFQYQFNDANNISQISDLAGTNSYGYDALDRLTSASHTNQPHESFGYDGVGNRTSSHLSATYNHQPFNRLVSTASAVYNYDTNGNLISKTDASGTTQYTWDFENRLKEVTLPNGNSARYKYDAFGRRIERSASVALPLPLTTTERFIYDGADVLRDTDANGVTLAEYLNGPGIDNKLRQTTATAARYFVQDHLGSTRALTDASGNVLEQRDYDSFGSSPGSAFTRYGYTGREHDPATGLLYYRARFYDPQLGRFISEDPIGLAGGINQFAYVGNSPQNGTDPSGLHEIDVHYYLTYYLAIKTGCFSPSDAREIANANQGMDDDQDTAPGWGRIQRQRDVNAFYHALHPGSHLPYMQTHWAIGSMGPRGNLQGFGGFLHYMQDVFSHEGFTDPEWGHSPFHLGTHNDDKTSHDVPKAMAMARATWNSLMDFAIQTGRCGCRNEPEVDMWKTVERFSEASGGGPWDRHYNSIENIDPGVLNNKRWILRLPRR